MFIYPINIIFCVHQKNEIAKKLQTSSITGRLRKKTLYVFIRHTIEVLLHDDKLCPVLNSARLTLFYGVLCFLLGR